MIGTRWTECEENEQIASTKRLKFVFGLERETKLDAIASDIAHRN